ncbi:putative carbonic anhydrase-like protein 1 [Eurytemora carolleeae]|uniref:putative carbonic anhydrase-like protein 1 n=1 Tax=Eurytemora carolleeae TaxID=1294199 RepID=UPI000C77CCC8|nr:putative carbonic anhydrase-like protein 1 [Eurytemora carolleeae]|eukprot:XP_023321642.1 putative carbonic anhydrase-like protein 1 [Eurytemora affinis]
MTKKSTSCVLQNVLLVLTCIGSISCNWEGWWTYEGISGPYYWGLMNPDWTTCAKGKLQSPIDIDPINLNYDGSLDSIRVEKKSVTGQFMNTGQSLVYRVDEGEGQDIGIAGGPLTYQYRFKEMYFHWANTGNPGSEHTVNKQSFPAEIQIYGFNSELYPNMSIARENPNGLVAFAILVQITESLYRKSDFDFISVHLDKLLHRGDIVKVPTFSLHQVLPRTEDYITYEGSSTFPGCWETVTWIGNQIHIFNKPIFITTKQLAHFQRLKHENNLRPLQPVNKRNIRTNVGIQAQKDSNPECTDGLNEIEYEPNIPVLPLNSRPYTP